MVTLSEPAPPNTPHPPLPDDFVVFWLGLCAIKPAVANAHITLLVRLRRWRAGDQDAAVPGYSTPPPAAYTELPEGWDLFRLNGIFKANCELRARRAPSTSLPPQFVEWLRQKYSLVAKDGDFAPVPDGFRFLYRHLLHRVDDWRDGDLGAAIPGYNNPPPSGTYYPGWSHANLLAIATATLTPAHH